MSWDSQRPIIRSRNLRKRFGSLEVLRGIDFELHAGQTSALIGPSGSGKSTLLRCINQLETIDGGLLEVKGQRLGVRHTRRGWVRLTEDEVRRQRLGIGMVFQRFNLFGHLTALDNIVLAQRKVLGRSKGEAREAAHRQLRRVGLANRGNAYPSQLSGGQQQRVAIARALAMDPEIMLFDEPTSALDPELVSEVLDVIAQLASERMTMIIVTHEIRFAQRAATTIHMLADGQIIESGSPDLLISAPSHERTRAFLAQVH
ncbi:amino acid ABC transporter ATP-binding protein [Bradyrhizobium zhanjiangense]|uniref:amino acid ABC transporter ATP-binding protein n=1 Tax=Bradyrhizobium zhanjiangense TaxID=1325107 RepID=UPI001ABEFB93|nr:amino acid ABC transporter ATP-binding protein [Bradyrhizobium zhanjiangense]